MMKKIKQLLYSHKSIDVYIEKNRREGAMQDIRLQKIYLATINGEQNWFLELVKKDPECVAKILKECDNDF